MPKSCSYHMKLNVSCTKHSLRMADISPRSSPLRDVSRGGTSATQQQKFHSDDVNQCLHNKSGSHGISNGNLFNFYGFSRLDFVKCSVHLRMSSSKTQMLLLEKIIFHKYWLFCYRFEFTFDLCDLLSFVCYS